MKKGKVTSKNYIEQVTFEFEKNKIVIPVEIEGKTYRFLLDTGAPNIISSELYEAIQPDHVANIPTEDANGMKQQLDVVTLKHLKIGAVEFEGFNALVFDLNGSSIFKCFGIDGFIGSNLLRHSVVQFNAEDRLLTLTDQPKKLGLNEKEGLKIKLVGSQSSPYIVIELDGTESRRETVLMDTGMGGFYNVSKRNYGIFKSENIFQPIGESTGASSISLFGETPTNTQTRVFLPELKINTTTFQNIITQTTADDGSKVGAELLNHGIMTIDFKRKRFYFKSTLETIDMSEPDIGFELTLKDKFFVVGYVWDTDLQDKLQYGDKILEVNGVVLDDSNFCKYVLKDAIINSENKFDISFEDNEGVIQNILVNKKELDTILADFNFQKN
ncbi:retropepsin-like aspartic protease [Psychroserpens sp.]|uniref:retropepsin-like aspartic protease n=1 Tax=Psychroserpens sp. TaxID=2020870 RepID=UPI0039E45465